MRRHVSLDAGFALVRTRRELLDDGCTSRGIESAVADGSLRRLQPNRYVEDSVWRELWPESRHRLEIASAFGQMRTDAAVAAYASAAAAWELPLARHVPTAVHVVLPNGTRASSRLGLVRHTDAICEEDIVEVAGIRCTSLERTVVDVARTLPFETSVALADAALRRVAMRGRRYDEGVAAQWREGVLDRLDRMPGARGVRRARAVAAFADGRAELPGESITRVRLRQLGFTRFHLQVPVRSPSGGRYEVDIGLDEAQALLEFDGKGKYLDAAMRDGLSLEDVLLAEKRREDWIRGVTQRRFGRVEDAHITTPAALGARLAAYGIRPPRKR